MRGEDTFHSFSDPVEKKLPRNHDGRYKSPSLLDFIHLLLYHFLHRGYPEGLDTHCESWTIPAMDGRKAAMPRTTGGPSSTSESPFTNE